MSTLPFNLDTEISKFRAYAGNISACGQITFAGPDILKFTPNRPLKKLKAGFLALVHGNEVIGLPILNTLIDNLLNGVLAVDFEILFGLGNLPAAYADKRFLSTDLNRCFGPTPIDSTEEKRAREIEQYLLNEVDYLIDLHQTVQASQNPFFIFQYSSPNCFSHLNLMNTKFPVVLQFDNIGDSQGLSTDEYLRGRGRFGVALELGQIGVTKEKFNDGLSVCTNFIKNLNQYENYEQLNVPYTGKMNFPLFEISERLLAPEDNSTLDPIWSNFTKFEKGDTLGMSPAGPVRAPRSGCVLFPKINQTLSKGQNMFFICSELIQRDMFAQDRADIFRMHNSSIHSVK
ncbi:succinylglutamate desuccinylase/aspartoacylase family protein [bacterium]|nr:succinylglutamate desuccinylase/aspartoacylase family protein [bacterium]